MKKKKIDENYIEGERKKIEEKDINHALTNEEEIKKKVSRLGKFKQQINLLFSMLKDYKNKKYTSVPWLSIAAITFALLYLLNPLDFMPDFIPFIGYVDDASIIGITLKLISEDLEAYQKWKEKSHLD
ncbi:YkvA family protein [Psychroflexus maritimus]|uniref:DUF1232 domain-containing protein n=1 Tax=Psychroflexus maritimus TaxID=2714865 RepID=A0A967AG11_9FLAO|nr:YkvA family protein [Psychroflexus maritimus]NGZ89836.1 DUF1232 domain-containing protein [Psychroflexus maritimus]